MLPPFNLPEGIVLLITDELSSPGDFILHRLLSSHFKDSKNPKGVILSVSEGVGRWKAIAAKFNINITQYISSGALTFVDVMSHVRSSLDSGQPSLRPVYDLIASELHATEEPFLIIFDDITSLQWVGFPIRDISRFTRSLRALSHQTRSTLVIRHHNVTPEEPDDVFRHLLHLCTYHLEFLPLSSGKSGSVSGEIALHPGMSTSAAGIKLIQRSSAVQYRLTDSGANFFDRGTGVGIL